MSELWKVLEKCRERKMMIRLAFFPGNHISLGIYDTEKQSKQYLYESKTGDIDQLNQDVLRDFRHLLAATVNKIPSFPTPAGFPKP